MESAPDNAFSCSHKLLLKGDYVSPNFRVVMPDKCFPQMKLGDIDAIKNRLFRKHIRHNWYIDPNFPDCGFLTRDEAHILYNNALQFAGRPALEIGSHVGWSTVHLALAGVRLDVVEPKLLHDPRVLMPLIQSLRAANVNQSTNLVAGYSPDEVIKLAEKQGRKWNFVFIDGNHTGEAPLKDAEICHKYAARDAMILFHDLAFPDVAAGFAWLAEMGWNARIYHTQQIMGVAWRGDVEPVEHFPDPKYDWELPDHLLSIPTK